MERRTKIVASLGPATDDPAVLEKVIKAGVNVVRLNFSHGDLEEHKRRADMVRSIADKLGLIVGVLGDLQGPKIRIERFKDQSIRLQTGDEFALDCELGQHEGNQDAVGVAYKDLAKDVKAGDVLMLDDGNISLTVNGVEGCCINTTVLSGGKLSDNKGINLQGGGLSAGALTDKDRRDIKLAAEIDVDFLAVSFVRNALQLVPDAPYTPDLAHPATGSYWPTQDLPYSL